MVARVILMCAGRAERWGGYLGTPKHLIRVDGETLLDRTLRLVRERRPAAAVTVVAFDPRYDRPGTDRFAPAHGPDDFTDTDKFLSSEPLWSPAGQTVILYGDVYFTEAAMTAILAHVGPHRFFGRGEGSYVTGCPHREMFALSFPPAERAALAGQMRQVRADLLAGRLPRGGGWEVYQRLHPGRWDQMTFIDDFTEDFDWPVDYDRWTRRFANPLHRAAVAVYGRQLKRWQCRLRAWRRRLRREGREQAVA